jgi:hypothetical protein
MGRGNGADKILLDEVVRFGFTDDVLVEYGIRDTDFVRRLTPFTAKMMESGILIDEEKLGKVMRDLRDDNLMGSALVNDALKDFFEIALEQSLSSDFALDTSIERARRVVRIAPFFSPLFAKHPTSMNFFHIMEKEGDIVSVCGRPITPAFQRGATYYDIKMHDQPVCRDCLRKIPQHLSGTLLVRKEQIIADEKMQESEAVRTHLSAKDKAPWRIKKRVREETTEDPIKILSAIDEEIDLTFARTLGKEAAAFYYSIPDNETRFRVMLSVLKTEGFAFEDQTSTQVICDALFANARWKDALSAKTEEEVEKAIAFAWIEAMKGEDANSLVLDDRYIAHLSANLFPTEIKRILESGQGNIPIDIIAIWQRNYHQEMGYPAKANGVDLVGRTLRFYIGEKGDDWNYVSQALEILIPVLKDDLRPSITPRAIIQEMQAKGMLSSTAGGGYQISVS